MTFRKLQGAQGFTATSTSSYCLQFTYSILSIYISPLIAIPTKTSTSPTSEERPEDSIQPMLEVISEVMIITSHKCSVIMCSAGTGQLISWRTCIGIMSRSRGERVHLTNGFTVWMRRLHLLFTHHVVHER